MPSKLRMVIHPPVYLHDDQEHRDQQIEEIRQKIDIASFCKNVADGRSIDMDHHKDVEIKKIRNYQQFFLWKICGKLYKNNVFFCFYPQNAVDKYIFY